MRKIEKRPEPEVLTRWRASNAGSPNFHYRELTERSAVIESLLHEQGRICAYTGQRIGPASAHIEHINPQAHCSDAESVDYQNMVACFPGPNKPSPGYGAVFKASWPSPEQRALFVSPLTAGCEARFRFDYKGQISAANASDAAAIETIRKLNLADSSLAKLRREAVQPLKRLKIKEAQQRLKSLAAEGERMTEFCFVVKQALEKHIRTLHRIRASKS